MSDETAPIEPASTKVSSSPRKGCWGCLALVILVPTLFLTWCQYHTWTPFPKEALAALENDPQATMFSIDPWPEDYEDETVGFRGHKIMGQIVLTSQEDRRFFAGELRRATRGAWDGAACFDPRHAFRASGPAGTYDFLVCFACGRAVLRMPDGSRLRLHIWGESDAFNRFLTEHHIPLAER